MGEMLHEAGGGSGIEQIATGLIDEDLILGINQVLALQFAEKKA